MIRFADLNDIDKIMHFIDQHWKKDHILSKDRELFLYEYQDGKRINFVIAEDDVGKLIGLLGFIRTSYEEEKKDIWAALWKVIDNDNPMLGVELLEYLRNSTDYNLLSSVGLNLKTLPIYSFLGIQTSFLNQYILVNSSLPDYKILTSTQKMTSDIVTHKDNCEYTITELNQDQLSFDFEILQKYVPVKDETYFIKRYFNHPHYKYRVYGIYKREIQVSLMVTREVVANEGKILRIMDYCGDEEHLQKVKASIADLLHRECYEYIDFMCYGFDEGALTAAGFTKIDPESNDLIAPNYFSPFVNENIKVYFYVDTQDGSHIRVCKADGDQDRPV